MLGFYEKRKLQRFLYSRYLLAFMVLPIGFLAYAAYNAFDGERETRARRVALEEELAALDARTVSLEEDITRLEDPYGIEAELRQRYDVGWEGEQAIVLVKEEVEEEQPMSDAPEPEVGWWERVWAKF